MVSAAPDADLDAYQVEHPWMPKVIRDLEHLAGED